MGFIYKIENTINHKIYIGQTIRSFEDRKKQHLQDSSRYDYPLYLAFRKYGVENFEWVIVEEVEDSILNEREQHWILFFDSMKNGYNCDEGGSIGAWSEDIKKKISSSLQGHSVSDDTKRKMKDACRPPISQITKDKIAASHKGKTQSEETKRVISEKLKGVSKKNKENYSKAWTKQAREKRSKQYSGNNNPNFGRTHSEETKLKISEAAKKRMPHIQTEEEKQKRAESIKAYWRSKHQEVKPLDTN